MPIDLEKMGAIATGESTYELWREQQTVPVVNGFYIDDMNQVEVAPWAWKVVREQYLIWKEQMKLTMPIFVKLRQAAS